jgi:putative phosphoribosyl transferase
MRRQQFRDRTAAGKLLADRLTRYAHWKDVLVLGLPRGGVPVAFEVAHALGAPLDVVVVRKLGVPGEEELAMGAIAAGGTRVLNEDVVRMLDIPPSVIETATRQQQAELERRVQRYRGNRPPPEVDGRVVIIVDDGIATGATIRAAIAAVRQQHPARIVVAAPAGAAETCEALRREVDEVVCLLEPEVFWGVGVWYEDFPQLTDDQVQELLARAWRPHHVAPEDQRQEHDIHP